jgi:hypothetical protein
MRNGKANAAQTARRARYADCSCIIHAQLPARCCPESENATKREQRWKLLQASAVFVASIGPAAADKAGIENARCQYSNAE